MLMAIVFQSVTISARTVAEKPISARSATLSVLAAATCRPACDSWFRVIFCLLFEVERTDSMALTMGPEREDRNAQQRNRKSSVDNLRRCMSRKGFPRQMIWISGARLAAIEGH